MSRPEAGPLRVAVFSDSYLPYVSGVVRSIELVRQELLHRGHRVAVFAPAYPAGRPRCVPELLPDPEESGRAWLPPWPDGPDVYRFPSFPAPRYPQFRVPVPWGPRLGRALVRFAPHVVHLHTPFVLGRLGLRAARRLGVPVLLTVHTQYDVYLEQYTGLASVVLKPGLLRLLRRFADACDAVVAPTHSVRRRLEKLGVQAPVVVLPSGVPVSHFARGDRLAMRRQWGIPPQRRVLMYVGRLSAEKNLGLLLQALERLAGRAPVALVLVGDGPLRPELARRAAGPMRGLLWVPGVVDYPQLPDALAAADVFVFPSQSETQGLAVVEAMAAGLPVVAVRSPELEEVAGKAALTVEPDAEALAAAVLRVLEDEELARSLVQQARAQAARFDLPRAVDRLLELYREVRSRAGQVASPA